MMTETSVLCALDSTGDIVIKYKSANNAIFNVVNVFYKLGQFGFKHLIGGPLETAIWGA